MIVDKWVKWRETNYVSFYRAKLTEFVTLYAIKKRPPSGGLDRR
jgi:hypothetical protein